MKIFRNGKFLIDSTANLHTIGFSRLFATSDDKHVIVTKQGKLSRSFIGPSVFFYKNISDSGKYISVDLFLDKKQIISLPILMNKSD